ncbi:MAG TPA: hypothetical protein VGQ12_15225 [Candidatus Angelobacter sp.]|nr:hypothetical protein [Candidatus Angelobacter sp.]
MAVIFALVAGTIVTIRTIVPPEGLLAADALMMRAFYIARLLSPAAAGALAARACSP